MALSSRITCESCGEVATVMHSPSTYPTICGQCLTKERQTERDKHFTKLDALSIEERLRLVEAWIYDYRPQYVRPPRY
jgi:hypothetical protein